MGQLILKILQYSNILHRYFNFYEGKGVALFYPVFSENEPCALAYRRRVDPDPGDDVANITGVYYIIHVLLIQYHHLN